MCVCVERNNMDIGIGLAHRERLQFRGSCSSAINCSSSQHRVNVFLMFWRRINLIKISLKSSANYFADWSEFAPPEIMENLITIEKIEQMPSPRVVKSHLPFHLLPPNLLDTAKVNSSNEFCVKCITLKFPLIRLFTLPATPRTLSFLFSTFTSWWNCVTSPEIWRTLLITLSITNVGVFIYSNLLRYQIQMSWYQLSELDTVFPDCARGVGQTWSS